MIFTARYYPRVSCTWYLTSSEGSQPRSLVFYPICKKANTWRRDYSDHGHYYCVYLPLPSCPAKLFFQVLADDPIRLIKGRVPMANTGPRLRYKACNAQRTEHVEVFISQHMRSRKISNAHNPNCSTQGIEVRVVMYILACLVALREDYEIVSKQCSSHGGPR